MSKKSKMGNVYRQTDEQTKGRQATDDKKSSPSSDELTKDFKNQ